MNANTDVDKREVIAVFAMIGLLAHKRSDELSFERIAENAFCMADAMMKESLHPWEPK